MGENNMCHLRDHLLSVIKVRPGVSRCLEDLVLTSGREFDIESRPRRIRQGIPKFCFSNCHKLARSHGWGYCEGYVITRRVPFAILHAWVRELRTGRYYEITLDEPPLAAIGFAFTKKYSKTAYITSNKSTSVSLIDAWDRGYPLLQMSGEELSRITIT